MTLKQHIIASGITSAYYAYVSHSWLGAAACFLSGIFIDMDHWVDYCWIKKKICWSLKELEDYCYHGNKEDKIFLFLHSYELLLTLWAAAFLFFNDPVWIGLVFGMTVHILLDQIFNGVYPWAYFLFYRAKHGFPHKIFFKKMFENDILKDSRELS